MAPDPQPKKDTVDSGADLKRISEELGIPYLGAMPDLNQCTGEEAKAAADEVRRNLEKNMRRGKDGTGD